MNPPALCEYYTRCRARVWLTFMAVSITRRMLKGYVLSDGTILEKGTNIALASGGVHMDSTIYQDPKTFDGYRAYKLRDKPGNGNKFQHTMTGPDSFTFGKLASSEDVPMRSLAEFTNTHFTGHGTHACPGRFFANAEMKLVLAYMLTHYDMKLKDGETRPMSEYQDVTVSANRNGKILIRARHDVGELS
jgi:ent-kaurene oxidase